MNDQTDPTWQTATRRLWLSTIFRYLGASLVLSPAIAVIALLSSEFLFFSPNSMLFISLILGVAVNLLAGLWATRQAIMKSYPEGKFVLVKNSSNEQSLTANI
jgi:hypothetical protein